MPKRNTIPEAKEVTERFLRAFEELRYRGLEKTKSNFSKHTGLVTSSNMDRMRNEQKEPTISNILLLNKVYGVSLRWIMTGEGEFIEEK